MAIYLMQHGGADAKDKVLNRVNWQIFEKE